ncbi:MAG: GNAT family N-acetyltransferase [Acidobacteria bacterium]|nr:GNAT family N-acetyltransferase [Acidobacteriota bacterium]
MSANAIVIRRCECIEELRACVEMQKEVWNFSDQDLVPLRLFVVAEKIGGQVIGAFDRGVMIGFVMGLPATRAGHSYLHSHMLAVRESHRNLGLGRKLKLAQRDDGLERGFELIEWTFDPLEIKNAHLNIERLGAIARRYTLNQYGISSSPLQGGLPTDRLIAEWWLQSKRVETLLSTGSRPEFRREKIIAVPAEIYQWKASEADRAKARDLQSRNREDFLSAFGDGLAVLGYDRDLEGNGKFLLGRWEEKWSYAS